MLKIRKNIIISVLLQTLGKISSKAVSARQDDKMLEFLRKTIAFANETIEKSGAIYRDLPPDEAEKEIERLDGMYLMLNKLFEMIFSEMTPAEIEVIEPEYSKLILNMDEIREGLELFCDEEFIQAMDEIAAGDYSNFVRVA